MWIDDPVDACVQCVAMGALLFGILGIVPLQGAHRSTIMIYSIAMFIPINVVIIIGASMAWRHYNRNWKDTSKITRMIILAVIGIYVCAFLSWICYSVYQTTPEFFEMIESQ